MLSVTEIVGVKLPVAFGVPLMTPVALLMENRPEHFVHKLAMNALGVCCVPLNPDHRPAEMAYVIGHARLDLVIAVDTLLATADARLYAAKAAGRDRAYTQAT